MLKALRGCDFGPKGALTTAGKACFDQLTTLVPAEAFGKGDLSSHFAARYWLISFDEDTTVDQRSPRRIEDPRDKFQATDPCDNFLEHDEIIDCRDGIAKEKK